MNIYTMLQPEAVKQIVNDYKVSEEAAKASIMKQTLLYNYDTARFWCGATLPERVDEDGDEIIDIDEYINNLNINELINIFDEMDYRFDAWCTPPRTMINEMKNKIEKEE